MLFYRQHAPPYLRVLTVKGYQEAYISCGIQSQCMKNDG